MNALLQLFVLALAGLFSALACSGATDAPWVGVALDGAPCAGPGAGNFGPFDYLSRKDKLPVVERRHFTPQIEQLQRGETTGNAMGDIQYTLIKFPNHHRALNSAITFALTEKNAAVRRSYYPVECFLQRAINFSPRDYVPHMLYGLYLHRKGMLKPSLAHYQAAEKLSPNDANLLYNIGLAYFDLKNYPESARYARRAYAAGVDLPGLKRKLQGAGHWQ